MKVRVIVERLLSFVCQHSFRCVVTSKDVRKSDINSAITVQPKEFIVGKRHMYRHRPTCTCMTGRQARSGFTTLARCPRLAHAVDSLRLCVRSAFRFHVSSSFRLCVLIVMPCADAQVDFVFPADAAADVAAASDASQRLAPAPSLAPPPPPPQLPPNRLRRVTATIS